MTGTCLRINGDLTVADLLRCWHETIPVFMRHRMACLGCPMAVFETLEGAAAVYGLNPDAFIEELRQVISSQEEEK